METEPHNRRTAPGHPVKYLLHRNAFDVGPQYRNIADWQFEKSKPLHRKNLLAHFGCVNAIEFSKDGSLLVSGGDDRRVLLWRMDRAIVSKEEPKVMQAEHLSNVFSLDFSCSSKTVISAGNDDQVILHDLNTGVPLDYFVHEQPVYGVSADPLNESIFCSACDDGRILIFDIREAGKDPFCLAKVNSAFHSVMFHPIEPRLVVTSNSKEGVSSWDVRMPKRVFVKYSMQNSSQCCMSARFNRMGTQILCLRRRLPPILYSTDSPSHLYQFNHRGYYNSCTMKSCSFAGQDDQYVMSGSDNFDLHVWKVPTPGSDQWVNKADLVLRGHRSIVNQVRYNYVHNVVASSGVEKIVKLWSPFPMPDERGGKSPTLITNESKRRIYTPDDYVSLMMQNGQGHFMSLTIEGGRRTTREDSRMLAFFDALVQRDINGLSDEESDHLCETSYTDTVYTSPESSSSENDDEDSNPPNFRNLLSTESNNNTFRNRIESTRSVRDQSAPDDVVPEHPAGSSSNVSSPRIDNQELVEDGSNNEPSSSSSTSEESDSDDSLDTNNDKCDTESNEQTAEDKDTETNVITKLIMEKEESRRKYTPRTNVSSQADGVSSGQDSHENQPHSSSSHRPLKVPNDNDSGKNASTSSSKASKKNYSKFRKQLLEMRRRERMGTPVYDSSRNVSETASSSETSYNRINELMTRNQTSCETYSSLDSSTSSSSESSSSDKDCEASENQSLSYEKRRKAPRSKKLNVIHSSSSSSSSSEVTNADSESGTSCVTKNKALSAPVATSSRSTVKDLKRKWRPQCKFNEACSSYFKGAHRKAEDFDIPRKRANVETSGNESINSVEQVVFKRLGRHKGRNYRKVASNNANETPPDSGIDVSRQPEACCSKSVRFGSPPSSDASQPKSTVNLISKKNDTVGGIVDDPGYGQIDSTSDSSDAE